MNRHPGSTPLANNAGGKDLEAGSKLSNAKSRRANAFERDTVDTELVRSDLFQAEQLQEALFQGDKYNTSTPVAVGSLMPGSRRICARKRKRLLYYKEALVSP